MKKIIVLLLWLLVATSIAAHYTKRIQASSSDTLQQKQAKVGANSPAAVFVVTSTGDNGGVDPPPGAGTGTLRQAIVDANASAGPHTINFNILPADSIKTIIPLSPLPPITKQVTIDGTSQPNYFGTPVIVLDGSMINSVFDSGLRLRTPMCIVRGLTVKSFDNATAGIDVGFTAKDCVIEDCFIGTDSTGMMAMGNNTGIIVHGSRTIIDHCVVSGNIEEGVFFLDGSNNSQMTDCIVGLNADGTADVQNGGDAVAFDSGVTGISVTNTRIWSSAIDCISIKSGVGSITVKGCRLNLKLPPAPPLAAGTAALPNGGNGIHIIGSSNNIIGGTNPGDGNVISNSQNGIKIEGGTASGNLIQGNLIGTDSTGTVAQGNALYGILIDGAPNNTIGGATAAARNVISGNGQEGILIVNGTGGNVVQNNFIGVDITGTNCLRNNTSGIGTGVSIGAPNCQFLNNVLGCNRGGIFLPSTGSTVGAMVKGNHIGTDLSDTLDLGNNGNGIAIGGKNNIIGGVLAGEGNTIAHNDIGISVFSFSATAAIGNRIRGNSVFDNAPVDSGSLGIDIGSFGVTPNDHCDSDTGGNTLQNYPVLTAASSSGGSTTIQGNCDSTANTTFTIDFYSNPDCNPSGNGEGKTYLGSAMVTTNASCSATINATLPVAVPAGQFITATCTDPNGNTSEFSACVAVTSATAVKLISFQANAYDNGTLLEWQTGLEVENLGFNLYRDEDGKRALVNPQLVAGSSLKASFRSPLQAGESYSWWDEKSLASSVAYWLEDIDLAGRSTWHGPFYVEKADGTRQKAAGSRQTAESRSALLREVGAEESANSISVVMERHAAPVAAKPAAQLEHATLASQAAVKLSVNREGWYRVSASELFAAGLSRDIDPRLLHLFANGEEVPISIISGQEKTDSLFASSPLPLFPSSGLHPFALSSLHPFTDNWAIEFYGLGIDTPSTDARTYWLTFGNTQGKRITQSKGEGVSSSSTSFMQTVERRDRSIYFAALLNGERENFFGAVIASQPVEQTLTARHIDSTSPQQIALEVTLQGVTVQRHRVLVQLNNQSVGEVIFNGQENQTAKFVAPSSLIREGVNVVRLFAQNGASDVSLVDTIRLSYPHTFTADREPLKFTAQGREQITVSGFTSDSIRVFDVTNANAPQELFGKIDKASDGYVISFASPASGSREFLALTNEQAQKPLSIKANQPSSWRAASNAADFVIISPRDFFAALEPLKLKRQAQGWRVAVVDVEDIYDEFNFGNKTPQAIKDFLLYARTNWKIVPRHLLFAGEASYDAKNYLGFGNNDSVPTKLVDTAYLETASDEWFSDFTGSGIGELATGRLPIRTADGLTLLIQKIISHEQSPSSSFAVLVADQNDGFDFEATTRQLHALLPENFRVEEILRGQVDAEIARSRLLKALNQGANVVNYTGHGSASLWRGNLLTTSDAAALTNRGNLSLFVTMTCLNGYFHDAASESLSEALLKAEGGAIAVWASSGLTPPNAQAVINQALFRIIFNGNVGKDTGITLGDAVRGAKQVIKDSDIRRTWILLGDPTMKWR